MTVASAAPDGAPSALPCLTPILKLALCPPRTAKLVNLLKERMYLHPDREAAAVAEDEMMGDGNPKGLVCGRVGMRCAGRPWVAAARASHLRPPPLAGAV